MIIFGQQDYAERLQRYLNALCSNEKVMLLAFPLNVQNPAEYVFDLSLYDKELCSVDKNTKIIIACGAKYRQRFIVHIKNLGFDNIEIYDTLMDNELKKKYFKEQFANEGKEFLLINDEKSVSVYMAKSVADKPLKNYPRNISKYIIPIQVGAALTEKKIADITDDTGDSISAHNPHFSETTALYWIWKNADADYLGLCHYRRLWKNLDFIVEKLQNGTIDVVLPLPTLCVRSVMEDYMEKYIPDVYPIMLEILKKMSPEYYNASTKIYREHIFYACNMLIAKRNVLNKLCEWMFPMVFEIEKQVGDLSDPYLNRYAGFCTERLITLYFLYNKENFKIVHGEKIFLGE